MPESQREATYRAAQRRKLREYASQDRVDADWFAYMGDPIRAAEYRLRACRLES